MAGPVNTTLAALANATASNGTDLLLAMDCLRYVVPDSPEHANVRARPAAARRILQCGLLWMRAGGAAGAVPGHDGLGARGHRRRR